jgi:hypothetical protein
VETGWCWLQHPHHYKQDNVVLYAEETVSFCD